MMAAEARPRGAGDSRTIPRADDPFHGMDPAMTQNGRSIAGAVGLWLVAVASAAAGPAGTDPFTHFDLPVDWQARFWADPGTKAVLALGPKDLAALVPVQAGF